MLPVAITIAGSDPSGGAGIQADLKTFHQFGVYGEAAITLLTVQNTESVDDVLCLDPGFVVRQIQTAISDIPPLAAKTGALGNAALIEAVAGLAGSFPCPLVVDPVMISKHGTPLMAAEARDVLAARLLPLAKLVTPNLHEAEALAGMAVGTLAEMEQAALRIQAMGAANVLVKGGHLAGDTTDLLLTEDGAVRLLPSLRIATVHTHGTGCTYSAAITAGLALGETLEAAVVGAKEFITEAIRTNPGLGRGNGPVNHFAPCGRRSNL
ncbi:MAG: bifunctional hydroxymethylpyrimidine kinase/phosphomethylpyrimidine kinase [Bryobacteraceae bacterium]|nr:bifunctional hydroxymethylpyrimidine kinase/phosphomethylpyrimidine kinase [Bryobacteraceae bacterium]